MNYMKLNIKKALWSILYAITVILLLVSCKAKETTVQDTKQSDTLITKSFSYRSEPISTDYSIKLECDSLGNVKPIQFKETSGKNKTDLHIRNNILNAKLLTGLSTIDIDSLLQASKYERDFSHKKTIIVKDWKTIIILSLFLLISVAVNVVFLYQKFKPKLPF